jgi:hypothetical protein
LNGSGGWLARYPHHKGTEGRYPSLGLWDNQVFAAARASIVILQPVEETLFVKIIATAFVTIGDKVLLVKVFEANGTTRMLVHLIDVHVGCDNILHRPSTLTANISLCEIDTSRFQNEVPSGDKIVKGNDIVNNCQEQDRC